MRRRVAVAVMLALGTVAAACREPDGPGGPGGGGTRMHVTSDPSGAAILVDQRDTGKSTPDTITDLGGSHVIRLALEVDGIEYDFTTQMSVARTGELLRLHAPLTVQCVPVQLSQCYGRLHRYHEAAGMRFATHDLGGLFMRQGSSQGVFWPAGQLNSYVSSAIPTIAGRVNGQAVSIGIYDHHYFAGRPAPVASKEDGLFRLTQEAWIVPPPGAFRRVATVRGMSVTQELIASDDVAGVVLVRLRFRNITDQPDYQVLDSFLGAGGATFTDTWIGLLLDADIGQADDDWFTYDPDLDMVYAYDARFQEPGFIGQPAVAPGLVGLRALQAPQGTTVKMNGWMISGQSADWRAGQVSEWFGLEFLSGTQSFNPSHPDPRIGHLPPTLGDVRLAISAGPLTLAPGQQAEIVLALALATPVPGTFETGLLVQPGNPVDPQRNIHRIAETLRERMRAAEALLQH